MQQKLWHWSGADYLGRSKFFQAINIHLTVTDDLVRAVFFGSIAESNYRSFNDPSPASEVSAILDSTVDLPVSILGPVNKSYMASDFGSQNLNLRITPLGSATLKRDADFLGSAEIDGPALYAFPTDPSGMPFAPFNVLSESFLTKRTSRNMRLQSFDSWPILVSVPNRDVPFTQAHFVVRNHADCFLTSNLTGWVMSNERPANNGIIGTIPTIKVVQTAITVPSGQSATVDVLVQEQDGTPYTDGSLTIYLEETGGFLPLRRVNSVGGSAAFRVSAMGMNPGETFKVKVGFRNYSGCDEVAVMVV